MSLPLFSLGQELGVQRCPRGEACGWVLGGGWGGGGGRSLLALSFPGAHLVGPHGAHLAWSLPEPAVRTCSSDSWRGAGRRSQEPRLPGTVPTGELCPEGPAQTTQDTPHPRRLSPGCHTIRPEALTRPTPGGQAGFLMGPPERLP